MLGGEKPMPLTEMLRAEMRATTAGYAALLYCVTIHPELLTIEIVQKAINTYGHLLGWENNNNE